MLAAPLFKNGTEFVLTIASFGVFVIGGVLLIHFLFERRRPTGHADTVLPATPTTAHGRARRFRIEIPRSGVDRAKLGFLSTVFLVFSSGALILFTKIEPAANLKQQLIKFALNECAASVLFISFFGIIWAIWAPAWLASALEKHATKMVFFLLGTTLFLGLVDRMID